MCFIYFSALFNLFPFKLINRFVLNNWGKGLNSVFSSQNKCFFSLQTKNVPTGKNNQSEILIMVIWGQQQNNEQTGLMYCSDNSVVYFGYYKSTLLRLKSDQISCFSIYSLRILLLINYWNDATNVVVSFIRLWLYF